MGYQKVKVPEYGFKIKLNHVYAEKWDQNIVPRLNQVLSLIPLVIRYAQKFQATFYRTF